LLWRLNWQVVPPACGAFGLTAWLRDTVAVGFLTPAIALTQMMRLAPSRSGVGSADLLALLRLLERQQKLTGRCQSIKPAAKIELTSRQSKISPAMISLEDWLSTADSHMTR